MHTTNEQTESNTTATASGQNNLQAWARRPRRQHHGGSATGRGQSAAAAALRGAEVSGVGEEQVKKGYEVISCYEAGPTGYWLHRKLEKLGVTNYVVCPTKLDSRGKGVSNDSRTRWSCWCGWTGMWRATRRPFRWCACPLRRRSRNGPWSAARPVAAQAAEFCGPGPDAVAGPRLSPGQPLVAGFPLGAVERAIARLAGEALEVFERIIECVDQGSASTDGASDGRRRRRNCRWAWAV